MLFAIEVRDDVIHLLHGRGVQPGDRLIEQQHFLRGTEGSRQQDTLLLTAGKIAIAAFDELRDAEFREKLFYTLFLGFAVKGTQSIRCEKAAERDFLAGGRKILLKIGLLRQITDLTRGESVAEGDFARERRGQTEQCLDQCRFAGAVFTDDAEVVATVDLKVDIFGNRVSFIAEGETACGKLRFGLRMPAYVLGRICHS